ncbi:DUF1800 domain-containing protein [Pseudomarimonas salicorniae]|uniref:DUF1800 domain-containing protein n=1 Tax=Pseudomarimonas salicorniae TaxID=2933270 RepID=A0ABT0GLR8_9GAMM|nr:DUF1800 family protein [Lysobacter sp. CAU 1642]MCK7595363.1 DUF1800 domain-containing protein [Lysobacter sp. CAU 1642]
MNLSIRRSAAAMALMLASTAQAYEIGPEISGTFFDPAQSGHGYILEYLETDSGPLLAVSWFAYSDGEPVWLVGAGPIDGDTASIPLSIGSGGDFPPRFVASQATLSDWGTLTLRFSGYKQGSASWNSPLAGFGSGSMPIVRLTSLSLAHDLPTGRVAACHSGSWFDASQPGHGLFVEIIGPPGQEQMVAIWYAYLNGAQRWMTAVGPINGSRAELTVSQPRGADFPPNFRSSDVVEQPWGSLVFEAVDGDSARLSWTSTLSGYGSGNLDLTRLSTPAGYECGDVDADKASRFLTQASFGPNPQAVDEVRQLGPAGWIDRQLGLEPTLQRPTVEQQVAAAVAVDPRPGPQQIVFRLDRWFSSALYAPDQLRQRMAFALSQIMVVSDISQLVNVPTVVAEYNDLLLRGAFGAYRDLLRDVTYSPAMGIYLTHLRNQKTDWTLDPDGALVAGATQPDENYAREVMQLFSIGLKELRLDGTPIEQDGQPVPTYDQTLITQTAKVLTGLSYDCSGPTTIGGITLNRNCGRVDDSTRFFSPTVFFSTPSRYAVPGTITGLAHPDFYRPMKCFPRYADTGRSATASNNFAILPAPNDRKILLAGVTIPPSEVACHAGTGGADQQACIDYCENQIDTLVDTLAAHPNVGPNFARLLIQRFTTSNPSPGYIERVAQVFENDGSGVRGNLGAMLRAILLDPEARATPARNFGKLREPLLKLTALWRALQAQPAPNGFVGAIDTSRFLAQRPLAAPSVFNFYSPDYTQPGVLSDAGLVGPEFEILNESTAISSSDGLLAVLFNGYRLDANNNISTANPQAYANIPPAVLDALPRGSAALVDALDDALLYGQMPAGMRSKLIALLDGEMATADHRLRVLNLTHLIAISPAFAAQL